MALSAQQLKAVLDGHFGSRLAACSVSIGEVRIDLDADQAVAVMTELRDEPALGFDQLIDICGVDYAAYGKAEWETFETSGSGFSRGRSSVVREDSGEDTRFAVVYHLLSVENNCRLRVHVDCPNDDFPMVDSVVDVWRCADWFEREAFDLYGIVFNGHPDLRRILTDYGFVGHPFRKDFPLSGHVEMRYDAQQNRVVYEPVSIEPRVLVPRVIREHAPRAEDRAVVADDGAAAAGEA